MARKKSKKPMPRVSTQIAGLRLLSNGFNQLESERDARLVRTNQFIEALSIVKQFLSGPDGADAAVDRFNEVALNSLQPEANVFETEDGHLWTHVYATLKGKKRGSLGLLYLWDYFFRNNGWERLKRCRQCQKWFIDETRPHKKEHCSERCKATWWNADRRREAGHAREKKQIPRRSKSQLKPGRRKSK